MLKSLDLIQNYSVPYEETQSNRVSDFRDLFCVSLFPKAILVYFYFTIGSFEGSKNYFLLRVTNKLEQKHQVDWLSVVQSNTGSRGQRDNRTYCLFKTSYYVDTMSYYPLFLSLEHRSAKSEFHCGVAPLRLETGRFECLDANRRICSICHSSVEDEKSCFYLDFRTVLFRKACEVNANFRNFTVHKEQFLLFSTLFYIYISNFRSQISYSFLKCGCSIYCFSQL